MKQLGELEKLLDAQTRQEVQILAISPDTREDSQDTINRLETQYGEKPDFPLLSDVDLKVIGRYGLLNPKNNKLPHPATYVIDRDGRIVWKFVEVDYKIRAANADILKALKE